VIDVVSPRGLEQADRIGRIAPAFVGRLVRRRVLLVRAREMGDPLAAFCRWPLIRYDQIASNPVMTQLLFIGAENPKHGGSLALDQLPEAAVLRRLVAFDPLPSLQNPKKLRHGGWLCKPLIDRAPFQLAII